MAGAGPIIVRRAGMTIGIAPHTQGALPIVLITIPAAHTNAVAQVAIGRPRRVGGTIGVAAAGDLFTGTIVTDLTRLIDPTECVRCTAFVFVAVQPVTSAQPDRRGHQNGKQ
jgi:hypothetical protein